MGARSQGSLSTLIKAATTLGPGWALMRSQLALTKHLGILRRRSPLYRWNDLALEGELNPGIPFVSAEYFVWRRDHSPSFLSTALSPECEEDFIGEGACRVADRVLDGKFPFFGYSQTLGFPPGWQGDSETRPISPADHWSIINEFKSGDIKLTWEPSRFTWVYALARAYKRTRNERYAEAFWNLYETWLDSNPPNAGVNWKCGQETAFRAMALCFGLYAFASSASTTPDRMARFVLSIATHAKRINAYIEYAISQKNNHGISEGVGLWTIGLIFPEIKGSTDWKTRGKKVIEREARRQIYADGSYVQHSVNYHRVMLHDLAWALRLGELHNDRLSPDVTERFRVSVRFLHALTDPVSGYAPNYGANDGALVLPLSDCDYPDMRPVLQSCHYLAERERLYPPGPWDEEMVWLNGPESRGERQIIVHRSELVANAGGYYTLHSPDSWIMLRAARYKDRPSHADQLHVDMWWRGENVLCDPGTYSYNAPAPFDHAFAGTRFHNCVTVDDADQMTRLSRFLWGDWANAHAHRVENRSDSLCVLEGEHDGYRRFGVRHRRAIVRIPGDNWIIVDDLVGTGHHSLRLHWLTQDVPFETIAPDTIDLKFNAGTMRLFLASSAEAHLDIVRAGRTVSGDPFPLRDPGRGWQSRYYARKEPALSIVMQCSSVLPVRFITVVMLGNPTDPALSASCKNLEIHSSRLALSSVGDTPIFSSSLDVTESPKTATPAQVD